MSTTERSVPGEPGEATVVPAPAPAPRRRTGRRVAGLLGVAAVLGLVGALFIPLAYYAYLPGSASPVGPRIQVPADRDHPPKGRVLFTTVGVQRLRVLGWIQAKFDHDAEVVPEKDVLGTTPPAEYDKLNLQLMKNAKDTASVVALRRLGYPVPERGDGAIVSSVVKDAPAAGRLKPGEVITAADGQPVTVAGDAVAVIRSHRPGDMVQFTVSPADGGASRTESVTLSTNPQRECLGFAGVSVVTRDQHFDYPFPVTINSGSIGGPSAGLAFTLGLLDQLSTGELTGGAKVAVTGTIELDGTVGPVGGVVQKTAAVRKSGARLFLVPGDEFKDAKTHAGKNLEVVEVDTLAQALDVLSRHGGDISALGPTPAPTAESAPPACPAPRS